MSLQDHQRYPRQGASHAPHTASDNIARSGNSWRSHPRTPGKDGNPHQTSIPMNRLYDYDEGRNFGIDRERGSQRSRGSVRSRGSYSSSPLSSEKPFQEKVKDCCRITIAFIFSNVGVCAMFVGYTIIGSFLFQVGKCRVCEILLIPGGQVSCLFDPSYSRWASVVFVGSFLFQAIERDDEAFKDISVEAERNRTIAYLWNVTHHFNVNNYHGWNDSTTVGVSSYQRYVIDAITRGYDGHDNATSYNPWSFEGGFLYSLTVITTIGYGHIAPKTTNGKVMTIVYAIFGMPVFLLYMANIGDMLAKALKWSGPVDPRYPTLEGGVEGEEAFQLDHPPRGVLPRPPPAHVVDQISMGSDSWRSVPSEKLDLSSVNIPITVSLVILFALLYGGTELFQSFEDWDPLTSFYFCFISLTTIGFGDIVPGSSVTAEKRLNFIYCSLYLMFGLALLSMCFNLMQEEVVHKFTVCIRSVNFFKRRKPDN
ncbi:Potassium channel domain [Trinorchestia longiramus]|nr:Potassium channel domain [Trinorchestia longiramus]